MPVSRNTQPGFSTIFRVILTVVPLYTCLVAATVASANERTSNAPKSLAEGLQAFIPTLTGDQDTFDLRGEVTVSMDDRPQRVTVRLSRYGSDSFDLELLHQDYALSIRRRRDATAMALPKHNVVFVGRGAVDSHDHLASAGFIDRCVTSRTSISTLVPMLLQSDAQALSGALSFAFQVAYDPATGRGTSNSGIDLQFGESGEVTIKGPNVHAHLTLRENPGDAAVVDNWPGMQQVDLPREELERQLSRGLRRVLEIQFPSRMLTAPLAKNESVEHGELRWIQGHRVAILRGSPEQIGKAHGELLQEESQACIDSVLYAFGTIETIRSGQWFREQLDAAYARLHPHIPERHKAETRALAAALGQPDDLLESLNVFPELFHCSGFAVFGKATLDGKLYHGRVLDYMTTIGLQDAATTFVVAADGQIPFVNVGYAGFIGSVSGMNAQAVSLGEMGGGGEGEWDGVPMATLMRRALEECGTLDEVMNLWSESPRTCEYYYVFADGKTNRAVGVAATPDSIEFIHPGQAHEKLGDGIEDAVVLSAGDRLTNLRNRVQDKYGSIDDSVARWLMSRPVAMESNLHNVLFIPADGVLFVANASHDKPAAECDYVRLDLRELLHAASAKQDRVSVLIEK